MRKEDEIPLRALGKRIRELRLERKMSQEDLAIVTGIDRPYISEIENGHKNPSFIVLMMIAQVFNMTFQEFADFEVPPVVMRKK